MEIGQQQVAHKTGYSRSSVAHAEAGRQLLTREFWKTADELVKAEGALLAAYERVQAVKQEQERRTRETALAGAFALAGSFRLENTKPLQLPSPPPLPSSDALVAASQETWRAVRSHLIRHRTQLGKHAVRLYDPAWRLAHTPALAPPSWLPSYPVPIDAVTLEWVPTPPRPTITSQEAELRPVLPLRAPGHAFRQYTSAIRYLRPPALFENRPSYRLLDVSWEPSGQGTLRFGLATFFDKLATLTLRRDTTDGSHTFFLLARDPAKVAVSGGQYGVIPAGEFQPSCIAPSCMQDDLDLWRNIVREYSEELLGEPEHDGSRILGDAPLYDTQYRRRILDRRNRPRHTPRDNATLAVHDLSWAVLATDGITK